MLKSLHLKYPLKIQHLRTGGISGFIPAKQEPVPGNVLVTDKLDKNAEEVLEEGGSVLLLTYGKVGKENGAQVAIGFSQFSGILHGQIISRLIHLEYYVIRRILFSMIFRQNITATGNGGIRFHIPRQ